MAAALMMAFTPYSRAQSFEIAAVVNDEAISVFDVELRAALLLQTGEATVRSADDRERVYNRALQELIEGALKRQEASRVGVEPTEEQIDAAIADIARTNGIPLNELTSGLGEPLASLRRRLRGEIAWAQAMPRLFGAEATVSDSELDTAEQNADPALRQTARDQEIALRQVFIPTTAGGDVETRRVADEVRAAATGGCADIARLHDQFNLEDRSDLGLMRLDELPDEIQRVVERLPVDAPSRPLRLRAGYTILFVCDRDFRTETIVDRDALAGQLRQQRIATLADRRLRDLRRAAIIEYR